MSLGVLDFTLPRPDFLNFGRTAQPDNELTIQYTMAPLTGVLSFFIGFRLAYHSAVVWQSGTPIQVAHLVTHQSATPRASTPAMLCGAAERLTGAVAIVSHQALPTPDTTAVPWMRLWSQPMHPSIRWGSADPHAEIFSIPCDVGEMIQQTDASCWMAGDSLRAVVSLPSQAGIRIRYVPSMPWSAGHADPQPISVLWDHGKPAPHGWRSSILPLPTDGKAWGRLNFVCPAGGTLNFGNACFGASRLLVAVQRSYRVINSAALIRVSDSADIPVSRLTIGLDWESWCWTLSATLMNRTGYERIPSAPGLVQATINGFVWRFVVDDVDYSRAFNTFGGQLTGRSPIALLAEPYTLQKSYRETSLKTAQQLLLQELPEGYSLTVTLPDWTIPANVFQYENLTPMEALIRIAKSCGGKVYAHKTDQTIYAVPKWPRKPWDWNAAADVTLPSSYTLKENLKQQEGFEYEAVMVSGGVDSGIVAICKRTGTGGLTHAPSAVDTLITHLDAATPRAIQELADHWPMKSYTLELPLQATPAGAGLIEPGTVIDFADGEDEGFRGLVVGVSISASWNEVTQTLELIAP